LRIQRSIVLLLIMAAIGILGACSSGEGSSEPSPSPTPTSQSSLATPADLASRSLLDALASGKPTLAEFGRGTCIPCKQMKPILEDLDAEYGEAINIIIVEIQNHPDLTRQYKIMAIPTQIFFDTGGKEVSRHIGFYAKDKIVTEFERLGFMPSE